MKSISMDEIQKKLSQRYEARPRKVRFKISSAYSGRVLKQVYEDGQELAPPEEESTHRFLHHTFESGDHFYRAAETPASRFYSSAKLTAQRISIFKEGSKYNLTSNTPLFSDYQASDGHHKVENTTDSRFRWFCFSFIQEFQNTLQTLINEAPPSPKKPSPILDFGKIVIFTSNLKIIRTPMDKKELMKKIIQNEGTDDCPFMYQDGNEGDGHQINGHVEDAENQLSHNQSVQEGDTEHSCSQCKGSGSAPCSLCHGSKFSMLANRFKESYRALRCPACNENGLQPCQICAR